MFMLEIVNIQELDFSSGIILVDEWLLVISSGIILIDEWLRSFWSFSCLFWNSHIKVQIITQEHSLPLIAITIPCNSFF